MKTTYSRTAPCITQEMPIQEWWTTSQNPKSTGKFNEAGNKEGRWLYFPSHTLPNLAHKSTPYKDGVIHGDELVFGEVGHTRILRYINKYENGKVVTKTVLYVADGMISSHGQYRNGRQHGLFESFWDEGNIRVRGVFKDDRKEGTWRYYNYMGQMTERTRYRKGRKHGVYTELHPVNGNPVLRISYVNNKRHGWQHSWVQGKLARKRRFSRGREVIVHEYPQPKKPTKAGVPDDSEVENFLLGVFETALI